MCLSFGELLFHVLEFFSQVLRALTTGANGFLNGTRSRSLACLERILCRSEFFCETLDSFMRDFQFFRSFTRLAELLAETFIFRVCFVAEQLERFSVGYGLASFLKLVRQTTFVRHGFISGIVSYFQL